MESVKRGDFIELRFTGKTDGNVFDSNEPSELKHLQQKEEQKPLSLIVGHRMLVHGLDNALEGKEIGKQYHVHLTAKDGFGPRQASLIRAIPLKMFHEQKVDPRPGMSLMLDQALVQIRAVSGARVIADFNNPLAGKELDYTFTVVKKITDLKDKATTFFTWFLRGVPEFTVHENKVTVKGPKILDHIMKTFEPKFKELVGAELAFEEVQKSEKNSSSVAGAQQSL